MDLGFAKKMVLFRMTSVIPNQRSTKHPSELDDEVT